MGSAQKDLSPFLFKDDPYGVNQGPLTLQDMIHIMVRWVGLSTFEKS